MDSSRDPEIEPDSVRAMLNGQRGLGSSKKVRPMRLPDDDEHAETPNEIEERLNWKHYLSNATKKEYP